MHPMSAVRASSVTTSPTLALRQGHRTNLICPQAPRSPRQSGRPLLPHPLTPSPPHPRIICTQVQRRGAGALDGAGQKTQLSCALFCAPRLLPHSHVAQTPFGSPHRSLSGGNRMLHGGDARQRVLTRSPAVRSTNLLCPRTRSAPCPALPFRIHRRRPWLQG